MNFGLPDIEAFLYHGLEPRARSSGCWLQLCGISGILLRVCALPLYPFIPLEACNRYDTAMDDTQKLLIVGAGHLGSRVAQKWLAEHPDNRVLAETHSSARHANLKDSRTTVRLFHDEAPAPLPHVLFCVPPSAVEDYAQHANRAVELWSRQGRLVMTSSTAVYAESRGGQCMEGSALATTERARRILDAEEQIRTAGGIVLRLAGLYDFFRGPHRVYLRRSTSNLRPDGWVSLLHYHDAARFCLAALLGGKPQTTYLGCDDTPLTRAQIADVAARSGLYPNDNPACTFTGGDGPQGRRCRNTTSREALGWQPEIADFITWSEMGDATSI